MFDDDDRWGVARLVAQREAERRAAEGATDDAEPAIDDAAVVPPATDVPDAAPVAEPTDVEPADAEPAAPSVEPAAEPVDAEPVDAEPVEAGPTVDVDDRAAGDPEDVPPPRAPLPPEPAVPPAPRPPLRNPLPAPRPPLPRPRRPHGVRLGPVVPNQSDARASRPRVDPDPALFGFARHTRGRLGGRLFTVFFVLVFAVIVIQTIASIV